MQNGPSSARMKPQGWLSAGGRHLTPCTSALRGRGGPSAPSRPSSFGLPSLRHRLALLCPLLAAVTLTCAWHNNVGDSLPGACADLLTVKVCEDCHLLCCPEDVGQCSLTLPGSHNKTSLSSCQCQATCCWMACLLLLAGRDRQPIHAVQGRLQPQVQSAEPGYHQVQQPVHRDHRVYQPRGVGCLQPGLDCSTQVFSSLRWYWLSQTSTGEISIHASFIVNKCVTTTPVHQLQRKRISMLDFSCVSIRVDTAKPVSNICMLSCAFIA